MSRFKYIVVLVVVSFLWIPSIGGDTEVSCVFMERCILPCSFQSGDEVVIHWHQQTAGNRRVHSFYTNQDQLGYQDQNFRGRTSLFKDQIFRGNASLLLTGVKVQDEGRYQCYTSTLSGNKESFVILKVDAPVHEVNIVQEGNRITCSSNWIYPKPELTWSTTPPSNETLKNTTTVQQNEQQLYNISSSLILSDSDSDLVYSCTISTGTNKRRNQRRATFRRLPSIVVSKAETTIFCSDSNTPLTNFSLIWRFNHDQIIVTRTGTDVNYTVSEEWRQQVKDVSESGSLTLQDLSSNQEGIYTCELRDEEGTYVTNAFMSQDNAVHPGIIGGGVAAAVLVVVVLVVVGCVCCKKKKDQQRGNAEQSNTSREDGVEKVPLNDQ